MGLPFKTLLRAMGGVPFPGIAPASFAKWTSALARGASNPARIMWNGDSNISGVGAGTGVSGLEGAVLLGMADQMATLAGHRHDSVFGDQNASPSVSMPLYDNRVVYGTGWAPLASPTTFGGRFYSAPAGSTGTLTFTPTDAFDKVVVWYPKLVGANTALELYLDGVLQTTLDQSTATPSIASFTINTTLGVHTVGVKAGATGVAYIHGFAVTDTSSSIPITLKGGWGSVRIVSLNDFTGARNGDAAKALLPDFYTLYCTINNIFDGTATATYQAAVDAMVAQLSPLANGCLIMGFPVGGSANWATFADPYATALKSIATSRGWGFYDSRNVFGPDNATANARGFRFDDRHPNLAGHTAFAASYLAQLRSWGMSI